MDETRARRASLTTLGVSSVIVLRWHAACAPIHPSDCVHGSFDAGQCLCDIGESPLEEPPPTSAACASQRWP